MKTNTLLYSVISFLLIATLFACGGGGKEKATEETTKTDSVASKSENKTEEKKETKKLEAGMTPFDFPTVKTFAKEGDYVLCPSYKMWIDKIATEDPTKETYIFYTAEMGKPGVVESQVKFTFDGEQMMPNSILIPIPKGQKAKVGDIVLTWWQTGSGMQRAIITEASNPEEPMARYLDLGWNNPAKDSKSGKGIGKTEYKLKPNSFTGINSFSPGSTIAAKADGKWNAVQVVSMAEGKVLTIGFAGKMAVYERKDCIGIPQKFKTQAGDKVQAVFVGSYKDATVVRVDEKMGVVFVKFENGSGKEEPVSFGEITLNLPKP
ncbi:MAG: hypothetical protein MUE85_04875 [Microscillaceae bacterium]|jgi:hypothetical protein|nr:hypothetical protein [Microscillaceae bacterium]